MKTFAKFQTDFGFCLSFELLSRGICTWKNQLTPLKAHKRFPD